MIAEEWLGEFFRNLNAVNVREQTWQVGFCTFEPSVEAPAIVIEAVEMPNNEVDDWRSALWKFSLAQGASDCAREVRFWIEG